MDMLIGVVGAMWVAAAAVFTVGVGRAAADDSPFRVEDAQEFRPVG
ncbi:hypothetical protein KVF89_27120 [Nocardioides carbamazepini]|jgi:hypothetical protein|nr:hypothetical protein [Nocardioides carbamazepini]MCR1786233.1 hypothetical protein [Nocardioides carbamazepini]